MEVHGTKLSFHRHEMEVRGTNFHFIGTKWKFAARTSISSARNGSSRHELPFHRHEMEVRGTNFHFIGTKWKFTARTSISSARNGSSRRELPFHRHETELGWNTDRQLHPIVLSA